MYIYIFIEVIISINMATDIVHRFINDVVGILFISACGVILYINITTNGIYGFIGGILTVSYFTYICYHGNGQSTILDIFFNFCLGLFWSLTADCGYRLFTN